jgi:parallel beta-helix repeat protein
MHKSIILNKTNFLWLLIIGVILSIVFVLPTKTATCPGLSEGDVFKVPNNTAVYLLNSNLERLYFPTGDVYKTWFADFSNVQEIAPECVDIYPAPSAPPFGVNYRPGSRLVKVIVSPTVYAVLPGNTLAKIGSEELAKELYGNNWSTLVRDVSDPFWPNYANRTNDLGEAIPHEGMIIKKTGSTEVFQVQNGSLYNIIDSLTSITSRDVRSLSSEVFEKVSLGGVSIQADNIVENPAQENVVLFTGEQAESQDETPNEVEEVVVQTPPAPAPLPPPAPITQHFCGNDINVPEETPYIQVAIDAACKDDTIIISAGTYNENLNIQTNNLTLKGASGTTAEDIIIDGGGKDNVIFVTLVKSFTIDGVTLQNSGQGATVPGNTGLFVEARWQATVNAKNLIVKENGFGIALWKSDEDRDFTISNSLIINNLYDGIDNRSTAPAVMIVKNNTIANNGRHGYHDNKEESIDNGDVVLKNNIIVGNGGAGIHPYDSANRTISYNNVFNNTIGNYMKHRSGEDISFVPDPGAGRLSVDPLFVSATDYHLQADSPMIDAGDVGNTDADGTRLDMGAYPF